MRRVRGVVCVAVVVAALSLRHVAATWWLLGMNSAQMQSSAELAPHRYREECNNLTYLVAKQKQLCRLSQNVLKTVTEGARMGISECQHQFNMHRWNCSTFSNSPHVFGHLLRIKSREKAYVYAISAAGVAYSVTRACSRGELTECGCDERIRQRPTRGSDAVPSSADGTEYSIIKDLAPEEPTFPYSCMKHSLGTEGVLGWEWGGCSEDLRFGEYFSKEFVDARETRNSAEGLMNLHNNEAGRRAIRSEMELVCKCHGVSGSCSMRVCWRRMAAFRNIGDSLLQRFEGAFIVRFVKKRKRKKLRPLKRGFKRPSRRDLVYLEESPDYCTRDEELGVLGTVGRLCNKTSWGMDGCRILCCGRGYQTMVRDVIEKCNCRFIWCCKVECEMCQVSREEHYCN